LFLQPDDHDLQPVDLIIYIMPAIAT
jgi:hypothetical protein